MLASVRYQTLMYTIKYPDRNNLKILFERDARERSGSYKCFNVPDILNKLWSLGLLARIEYTFVYLLK